MALNFGAALGGQFNVRKDEVCSICVQSFNDARLLSCLHSLCRECIDQLSVTGDGGSVHCPLCQTVCELPENGAAGLPKTYTISPGVSNVAPDSLGLNVGSMLCDMCPGRKGKAAAFWCTCQRALCKNHTTKHLSEAAEGEHWIRAISESGDCTSSPPRKRRAASSPGLSVPLCYKHSQPLRLHCGQCDAAVCGECTGVGEHHGHKPIQYVKDIIEQRTAEVAQRVSELESNTIVRLDRALDSVDKVRNELEQRSEKACADIKQAGKRAVRAVGTRVAKLIQQVDDLKDGRLKILDQQHDELKRHRDAAKNAVLFSEKLLHGSEKGEVMFSLLHALDKRTSGLASSEIEEQPQHHSRLEFNKARDDLLSTKADEAVGSVEPCQGSAQHCNIEGQCSASTGGMVKLTLRAADIHGKLMTGGGDFIWPRWVAISAEPTPSIRVQDNNDGSYIISCSSSAAGKYQLEISINGESMSSLQSITFS